MYKDSEIIKKACNNVLRNKWGQDYHPVGFSDSMYYLPTLNEFRKYIHYNRIAISPNNPITGTEGFDCDDYSFILKGHISIFNRDVAKKTHSWAVGIIWGNFRWVSNLHATNWVATRDKGLWLYEPQQYENGFYRFDKCLGNVKLILL
jgi:hypothetical protein